MIVKKKKLLC